MCPNKHVPGSGFAGQASRNKHSESLAEKQGCLFRKKGVVLAQRLQDILDLVEVSDQSRSFDVGNPFAVFE